MSKKETKLGIVFVCLAATMWGFDGVVLTLRLWNLDVSYVVFMLHALPFIGMSFILFKEYKIIKTVEKSDLLYFYKISVNQVSETEEIHKSPKLCAASK